jgi:Co/Zn/Cd efflux system component
LRGAYLHVLADAATSLFAILALFGGKRWGAAWLDPVMGLAGAALVSVWAYGLLRDSARALLDAEMDAPVVAEICGLVAELPVTADIADLHVWRVGQSRYACILTLVTAEVITPARVRQALSIHEELVHITVEINAGSPIKTR